MANNRFTFSAAVVSLNGKIASRVAHFLSVKNRYVMGCDISVGRAMINRPDYLFQGEYYGE